MQKTKLIAGNWKMNGRRAMATGLLAGLRGVADSAPGRAEIAVCPPAPYLAQAAAAVAGSAISLGAQDCSERSDGAYTGDISASMLVDMGCRYVILGHSERRDYHKESDTLVAAKVAAAHAAGLTAILCIGEKDPSMSHDDRVACLKIQLRNSLPGSARAANTVIAYEPVWAIGSGLTPTAEQITALHTAIRAHLPPAMGETARILYGGSVKADNAAAILALPGVDGALVGGASLKLADFSAIVSATP